MLSVKFPGTALNHVFRSDLAFKRIFEDAGLTVVHEQVQQGLPEGLFVVKM